MIALSHTHNAPLVFEHNQRAAQQVIKCVLEGTYCTLLGPRFAGKTVLLHYVKHELERDPALDCIYLSLSTIDHSSTAAFFSTLAGAVMDHLASAQRLRDDLAIDATNSPTFRAFLAAAIETMQRDLVLLLDDLEQVPIDLLRALLSSLRAIHMEQQARSWSPARRLVIVAAGALSLATHTMGEASPFRGIAEAIPIGDLNDDESRAIIARHIKLHPAVITHSAGEHILAAAKGDAYLLKRISQQCMDKAARTPKQRLTPQIVARVVRRFMREDAPQYQPLSEAARQIEENPDLLCCLLLLLKHENVLRSELPLPLFTDLDPLYLTGIIHEHPTGSYHIRNQIYRMFLVNHFDTRRVGRLLTMAGLWDLAVDYLADHARQGDVYSRSYLLDVTITAIHAADDYQRAASFAARALAAIFDRNQAHFWLTLADDRSLTQVFPPGEAQTLAHDAQRLEMQAFREGYMHTEECTNCVKECVPLWSNSHKAIGVVTLIRPAGSAPFHEQDETQLASYLNQVARALHEMLNHRKRAEVLRDIALVFGGVSDTQRVLDLTLDQMARLIPFDTASVQLLDESKQKLRISVCQGFTNPEAIKQLSFPLDETYPNARVWRRKAPQRYAHIRNDFKHLSDPKYQMSRTNSWLGVPLLAGDEVIGVITLDFYTPDFYTLAHENLAMLVANHAAIAIQRTRLVGWKDEVSHLIRAITRMTGSVRDSEQTWRLILDGALRLTGAEAGNISRVDEAGGMLIDMAQQGFADLVPVREIAADSIQGWVALKRSSVLIHDVAQQPEWQGIYHEELDTTVSELAVPIFRGETKTLVGIINLESPRSYAFSNRDQQLLEDLAVHADLALDNAQQYRDVTEHSQRLKALYESARMIAQAGLEIDAVLQAILDQAVVVTRATFGTIQLVEGNDLVFKTAWPVEQKGILEQHIGHIPIAGPGITARAVRENHAQLVRDVTRDPQFLPGPNATGCELVVVLQRDGQAIGVLNVERPEPGTLNEHDLELLEGLAHLAFVALQNAERYTELERTKDSLLSTQAVAWLGIFGADWKHTIHQHTFSVGNDVAGLRRLLRQAQVPDADIQQGLLALQRIEEVLNQIRSVPAAADGDFSADTLVDEMLREKVRGWSKRYSGINVTLDLHCDGLRARIGTLAFSMALEKLVNNALKAMGNTGELYVASHQAGPMVDVYIRDTGPGIPSEARKFFLERPIQRKQQSNGTGTGALMAKFIAQIHDGNLTWQPSPHGKGTELRLHLPIARAE